jgi:hypothetical protein
MSFLKASQRAKLKKSQFAIPSRAPKSGSYPVNDANHARNTLARVSQHGSSSEKAQVRAAVRKRFPNIKVGK